MQHTLSNHRSERDARIAHWNWGARDRLLREDEDQLWAAYWEAEQIRRKLDNGELTEDQAGGTLEQVTARAKARKQEYDDFVASS